MFSACFPELARRSTKVLRNYCCCGPIEWILGSRAKVFALKSNGYFYLFVFDEVETLEKLNCLKNFENFLEKIDFKTETKMIKKLRKFAKKLCILTCM